MIATWEKMGKPDPPTREQTEALRKAASAMEKEVIRANGDGVIEVKRMVAPCSLVLITQQP
jgi:xylan 1,4-beta-xylosidase